MRFSENKSESEKIQKIDISLLIKKIKNINLKENKISEIKNLSNSIYLEWKKIRNKSRKKINEKLKAGYEAEEEIMVGMLSLLNEKIIDCILDINKK